MSKRSAEVQGSKDDIDFTAREASWGSRAMDDKPRLAPTSVMKDRK